VPQAALSDHGRTLLLTSAFIDRCVGESTSSNLDEPWHRSEWPLSSCGPFCSLASVSTAVLLRCRSRITSWLTEQEENHRFLIFQA
jgi:hypothetical protein